MKSLFLIGCLMALTGPAVHAQDRRDEPERKIWKSPGSVGDSLSLFHSFTAGKLQGHIRYIFMATENSSNYSDYYANAVSGAVKYSTAIYHGFSIAVSGSAVHNLGSSDLTRHDEASNQTSRYELGLFDILNPSRRGILLRPEELNARYQIKKWLIVAGRQLMNGPFINLQDGRMRPTEVEGLYVKGSFSKWKLEAAYINRISPRSTLRWYGIGQSIGLYPQGVNADGSRSDYGSNLSSPGILITGAHYQIEKKFQVHLWNQLVTDIFNSLMLRSDYALINDEHNNLSASVQVVRQDAVRFGGNADPSKTYFQKGDRSLSFGAMLAWKLDNFKTTFNFNRITAAGRYLMPREYGKDPFFTFLPRERSDGFGDATTFMTQLTYQVKNFETSMAAGYYHLPDVRNFALNKYGLPSYVQMNADGKYHFGGVAEGLDAEILMAYKVKTGNSYGMPGYEINKVDMLQANLILNYYF